MIALSSPRIRSHHGAISCIVLATTLCIALSPTLSAQIVRGQVIDSISGAPIDSGIVLLLDPTGSEIDRTITDPDGLFLLRAGGAGRFRLQAEAARYRMSLFPSFDLAESQVLAYRLLIAALDPSADLVGDSDDEIIARVCADGVMPGQPVLLGLVRNAETQEPVAEASVILSWSDVPGALREHVSDLVDAQGAAITGSTGFYAVCGAPVGVDIAVHAERQGMPSELMRLRFEDGGVHIRNTFTTMTSPIWRQDLELFPMSMRTASIAGTVTDTSGRRLSNANVHVSGLSFATRTGLFGEFVLERLPPGRFRLGVEAAGYRATYEDVDVASGQTVELPLSFLALAPAPTVLAPVTVEAERPTHRRDLSEFEKRRSSTTGSFITRDEFEKRGNVRRTTDILRRMRGVRVNPGLGALEWMITTSRGASRGGMNNPNNVCFPLIFIDRQFLGDAGSFNIDQQIPVVNIEAVEAYTSSAGMPPIYNRTGAVCGVIAFWTR